MVEYSLADEIKNAQARIRQVKKYSPYVYNEYALLKRAERDLVEAQKNYDEAKERWEALGQD